MNKGNKKLIVGGVIAGSLMLGGAGLVIGVGIAHADASQDSQYVACVAQDGLYSDSGPSAMAARGRQIANDISLGIRTVAEEQHYVYLATDASVHQSDANVLVNCATTVYLGYGPGGNSNTAFRLASNVAHDKKGGGHSGGHSKKH